MVSIARLGCGQWTGLVIMNLLRAVATLVIVQLAAPILTCRPLEAQAATQAIPAPSSVETDSRVPSAARELRHASTPPVVNSASMMTEHAVADISALPKVVPTGRPAIGLALEGGGALGLAHIGVLQWMEDNHIPVDRIAGTSMGAMIGGLYASGRSPAELKKIAASDVFRAVFAMEIPYIDASFRRREDRRELPQAIQFGLKGGASLRNAVLVDAGLNEFLAANLSRYNRSDLSYDSLPIPFRCVATDLNTMQQVVFAGGSMPQAIHASIAIPGIFPPVQYANHYLVDGAIMDNLPTDIVKQDLHADVVIAVHLESLGFSESDVSSVVGIFARAYAAGTAKNERVGKTLADVLISADTGKFSTADYNKGSELIAAGYAAAEKNSAALKKYALNDEEWNAYILDRRHRERPQPSTLRMVKVEGGSPGAQDVAQTDVSKLKGQPIDSVAVSKTLRHVQGNGAYQANFETFAPDIPSPSDRMSAAGPDTGVLVRLNKVRNGPPFLLLGPDMTGMSSNVTRGAVDLRFIDQNLGGYDSELRADLRFGFLTQVAVEYYRQLTRSGYYFQPHIGFLREPVYLWDNQSRISERLSQQAGGGIDVGRTFSRNLQASLQWRMQSLRWHLVNGSDGTQDISGTAQTGTANIVFDRTESGTISAHGSRLNISAGSLFNAAGSRNAPLFEVHTGKTFKMPGRSILALSAEGNTYFRRNVAEPLRFTLGGPLRLSASSIDEYRGTDDFLVRSGYLHRIATLPTGLGDGLYLSAGYEGGEIWAPERRAFLRQDGLLGVIAATPLGAFTVGGAVGDAGRRKIFFTFGHLF
jgi:NTE family protein